jgi:hypothetical protein
MPMTAPAAAAQRRRATPDLFGYDPAFHQSVRPLVEFLYRRYWRVRVEGLEHVPAEGAALSSAITRAAFHSTPA